MPVRRPVLNTASDFPLMLDPGGAPVVAQSAGAGGGTTLGALSLSTTAFTAGGSPGDVLASITGKTSGSTLAISPSDTTGVFAISGTNLVKGLNWPSSGSSTPTVQLREVLAGATNTPRDTTIASTIAAPPPTLQSLLLSTTAFTAGGSPGDVLAAISGKTAGSTITISPSDTTGVFAVSGTNLLKGLNWPASGASTPNVYLRETLAGATNTPHDTPAIGATISSGHTDTFLPTTNTPYAVFGVGKIVAAYPAGQKLYTLKNLTTTNTFDVLAGSGNAPANLAAAIAWATTSPASPTDRIVFSTHYDQLGSAKTLVGADATAPVFDTRQALAGIPPAVHDGFGNPTAGITNQVFTTLSGVSISTQSMSVFDVLDPYYSYQREYFWSARPAANNVEATHVANSGNGTVVVNGVVCGAQPRSQPSVIAAVGSASATSTWIRETKTSVAATTAGTATYFYLGTGLAGTDYYGRHRRWAWVLYNTPLVDADVVAVNAALAAAFTIPTTFTSRLVIAGTSLAAGYLNKYAYNVSQSLNLPASVELFNTAVSGEALTAPAADAGGLGYGGFNAKFTAHVGNLYTSAYGAGKCALLLEHGSNDIGAYSTTGVTTMTAKAQAIAAAKALGYKTLATTIMPRNDTAWNSTKEAYRIDFNNRQRANDGGTVGSTGIADYIIDGAADTLLGDSAGVYPTGPVPGTYWNSDSLHWTDLGAARVAQNEWRPQIAACLGFT